MIFGFFNRNLIFGDSEGGNTLTSDLPRGSSTIIGFELLLTKEPDLCVLWRMTLLTTHSPTEYRIVWVLQVGGLYNVIP